MGVLAEEQPYSRQLTLRQYRGLRTRDDLNLARDTIKAIFRIGSDVHGSIGTYRQTA